jgi:PhnB protein
MSTSQFQPIVTATLSVRNGQKAVAFYKSAFAAVELFRVEDDEGHVVAQLSIEGATFWVADESPDHQNFSPESLGGCSVRMLLIVEDPDAVYKSAIAAGAKAIAPVEEAHGWRMGRIADPFGHHWEIGKPITYQVI